MSWNLFILLFTLSNCSFLNCVLSDHIVHTAMGPNSTAEQYQNCINYFDEIKNDLQNSLVSIAKYLGGITKRIGSLEKDMTTKIRLTTKNLQKLQASVITQLGEIKSDQVRQLKDEQLAVLEQLNRRARNYENHFNKQIQNNNQEMSGKLNQTMQDFQLFQVKPNEPSMTTKHQDGGCGGILIAEKGSITYSHQWSENTTEAVRCIWTVRANHYEKVAFKLASGNVETSLIATLTLNALNTLNKENSTITALRDDSRRIWGKHLFVLEGPVVFVTFMSNYSAVPLHFVLYFEGRGNLNNTLVKYRHYHFAELQGEVDYPRMEGVDEYSPNETVTFVINPPLPKFDIRMIYIDLETTSNCQSDALTFNEPSLNFYYRLAYGFLSQDNRYCLEDTKLIGRTGGSGTKNAFIVTFKSDGINQRTGFRFSWPS